MQRPFGYSELLGNAIERQVERSGAGNLGDRLAPFGGDKQARTEERGRIGRTGHVPMLPGVTQGVNAGRKGSNFATLKVW